MLGGPFGERSQSATDEIVACFAEQGGRWIETAHSYAEGGAESSVALALDVAPARLSVITKVGHPNTDGRSTLQIAELIEQAEVSCDRLRRPVDLILLHRDDEDQPVEHLAEALDAMLGRGTALSVGVSNWRADRAIQARGLLGPRFVASSLQFSIVQPVSPIWPGTRSASLAELDILGAANLDLISWSPLARGWVPKPDKVSSDIRVAFRSQHNRRVLEECDLIGVEVGLSRSEVALAGLLGFGANIRPVVGVSQPDEVYSLVRVAQFVSQGGGDLVATMLRGSS